jgi:Nif-specific regulatory protein
MKPIEEVTLLYEITNALNEHLDLRKSLYKVLDILSSSLNMVQYGAGHYNNFESSAQ